MAASCGGSVAGGPVSDEIKRATVLARRDDAVLQVTVDPPEVRAGKAPVLFDDPPNCERLVVHPLQDLPTRCPPDRRLLPVEIPQRACGQPRGLELCDHLGCEESSEWAKVIRPGVGREDGEQRSGVGGVQALSHFDSQDVRVPVVLGR